MGIDFTQEKPSEGINEGNLRKWTTWLFAKNDQNKTRLIGTSGDLSKLNKILGDEQATLAFDEKGFELDKAYELTDDLSELFADSISKSLQYLEQADSVVHRITNFYAGLDEDLSSIRKLATKIKNSKDSSEDDRT
jgi:hypothetical protein